MSSTVFMEKVDGPWPFISESRKLCSNEWSADVRVVTDAVAMDDGIYQRKRAQEKDQQN